ncbi:polymorphic toxin-type HINT domain-containing protein, partial [Streptomyces fumanus]|uniref:polymorphic toxin-type HINT domain-containing protein n=1 Tax=Streptomyces fumanus TaxID=67302 RepID=UPI001E3E7373
GVQVPVGQVPGGGELVDGRARARAARAAAKKAAARRAAARKAAARPKPRAKPRSQPRPRPKPRQVQRAVKKVAKEVREEAKESAKEEVQTQIQGESCEFNSFRPGTLVLMADGSTKPIEKVRAGDKVVATDPRTGKTTVQTAAATITGKGRKDLVRITLKVHDGSSAAKTSTTTVTATAGHPFWVPTLREWVDAGDLEPGQWVRTSSGTWIQIATVEAWTAPVATVHNLTVTDVHTYYVLAGPVPVLVHNAKCKTVAENDAGRFGDLNPGQPGDGLEAHHMPQDGLGFLARNEGGAIVMKASDHALTRTYKSRGRRTKRLEAGLPFRTVLARDIWDMRRIGQIQYGDPGYFNTGIRRLLAYYRRIGMI